MVKEVQFLKHKWFKNDTKDGGSQDVAIKCCSASNIVVHTQTQKNGRMWGSVSPNALLNIIEKNYGIYEVITKYPHKVYFDIDDCEIIGVFDDVMKQNHLDNTLQHINHYFPNADIAVSGSYTAEKISYHFVLNNYVVYNDDEKQTLKLLTKYICENCDKSFDWKVYTKNRNMKCINQSKDDGRVQSILINDDWKKHLITCFINNNSLSFPKLPNIIHHEILLEKAKKTFNLGELPKMVLKCPDNLDLLDMTAEEVLSLLPYNKTDFNFDYQHKVARFCFTNDISFDMYLNWLRQGIPDIQRTNAGVELWSKLNQFPPCSIEQIKPILIHFYPHINKDLAYRQFCETFNLPKHLITEIETIDQNCFINDKKWNVFNIGMGGGKTAQTITYLQYQPNFLWIAPNIALGYNTLKRFEDIDIDVKYYSQFKTKDKKEGLLNEEDKLIICLNSLHYLSNATFEIIVIDEIETLVDKFLGDFMEQGDKKLKKKIWDIFINLLHNAKKVILLDAFITTKTINLINKIDTNSVEIFKRKFEPQTRTIKYLNNFEMTMKDIIDKIKNGNKLFIFYPYKRDTGSNYSMERVYKMIKEETGMDGVYYNADVGDKIKQQLKDVNTSWSNKRFIITNNIITCGVNYEELDFDYKYLFIASFNTPRDIIQVSYRARYLSTGIINICYMGAMNQVNTWLNDTDIISCPIYSELYKNILIEKKAPLKRSFQLFCNKAHYKQVTEEKQIDAKIENEIKHLLLKQQAGYNYDNIEDIDINWAEILQEKCFSQEATMYEKMLLKKYYFKKKFIDTADKEVKHLGFKGEVETNALSYIWNENYSFFFDRMKLLLCNQDNIFNKIKELNKLETIFPTDVKKLKLNEDIKDLIFKNFSFKFISKTSASNKIIKEIYNTFFGSFIITSNVDENKNATYQINEEVNEMYYFACKNLILDHNLNITYDNLICEQEEAFEF